MSLPQQNLTELLIAWREGDNTALDKLMPLAYQELRRLAHRYVRREGPGQTLETTSLVHEAYLRLAERDQVKWENRAHFFAVCCQVMRTLLVDRARARRTAKRGGGSMNQVDADKIAAVGQGRDEQILALDEALNRLAALDPRKGRIVEMRYFGGMSVEETSDVLGVSAITVKREWLKARAWLNRELTDA